MQTNKLKPEYKSILIDFSDRFAAATDYGGGRAPWLKFLREKVKHLRSLIAHLPMQAQ